ncbi:MAG: hypothetical protein CMP23_03100 [Rickettsiales bacterium]|nr:hypothetical protein [Rickettsiales bacterium]
MSTNSGPQDRSFRKARGQFFTPSEVSRSLLSCAAADLLQLGLEPLQTGPLLDPSCGDGSFLAAALAESWVKGSSELCGIDIDDEVLGGPVGSQLVHGDGLQVEVPGDGSFAAAVGNPPYGGRGLKELGDAQLQRIGTRLECWRLDSEGRPRPLGSSGWNRLRRFPIASLFAERFVRSVRAGGLIAVLLPESLLCNRRDSPLRAWLLRHCRLVSVTELPANTFAATGTRARTHFVVLRRRTRPLEAIHSLPQAEEVLLRQMGSDRPVQRLAAAKLQQRGRWDPDFHQPHWDRHLASCRLELKPLDGFVDSLSYGAIRVGERPELSAQGGSFYVTQKAVKDWGVDLQRCQTIASQAPFDTPRYRLEPGDLVVPRCGRGTLGRNRLTRFDGAPLPAVVDCFTDRLRLVGISTAWVLGVLRSPLGWDQIRRTFNGVGTPNLSFAEIRSLMVPIPSGSQAQQAESMWLQVANRKLPLDALRGFVHSACGLD